MKKIYVGNLPFSASEDDIKKQFSQHGTAHSVALIMDRETGRPRGFGFIEVDDNDLVAIIGTDEARKCFQEMSAPASAPAPAETSA